MSCNFLERRGGRWSGGDDSGCCPGPHSVRLGNTVVLMYCRGDDVADTRVEAELETAYQGLRGGRRPVGSSESYTSSKSWSRRQLEQETGELSAVQVVLVVWLPGEV